MRHLAILAWKEWREGWSTTLAVWCLAACGWLLAPDPETNLNPLWALIAFTGAALLGGRAFAGEAEAKTLRFLTGQPVDLDTIWTAKFSLATVALGVFYLVGYAAASGGLWKHEARPLDIVFFILPLVSFALALLLSTAVDNTILACVGGVVGGFGHLLPVVLLAPADSETLTRNPAADVVALCVVLIAAPLYALASRYVFRYRARR